MCQKLEKKSTKEEIDNFFKKLKQLFDSVPEDVVVINLAMLDPHKYESGNLMVAAHGSGCALRQLVINSTGESKDLRNILNSAIIDRPFASAVAEAFKKRWS